MPDRRTFSAKVKRAAWKRCNGHCEKCTAPIAAGGFTYDHIVPWELSRDSSLDNCWCICKSCDATKTYQRDLPTIAHVKRVGDFHHGISGPGLGDSRMPCGRMSASRKTIKGRVIERKSQSQLYRAAMARRYGGFA